jgi:hypothetical protein
MVEFRIRLTFLSSTRSSSTRTSSPAPSRMHCSTTGLPVPEHPTTAIASDCRRLPAKKTQEPHVLRCKRGQLSRAGCHALSLRLHADSAHEPAIRRTSLLASHSAQRRDCFSLALGVSRDRLPVSFLVPARLCPLVGSGRPGALAACLAFPILTDPTRVIQMEPGLAIARQQSTGCPKCR